MTTFYRLLSTFVVLLLSFSPAFSAGSTVYEKAAFKPALDNAVGKIYKNHGGQSGYVKDSAGGKVTYDELANVAPGGAWRVMLGIGCELPGTHNSASNEYGKLMRYNSPAIVANNRDGFSYVFQTQAVEDAHLLKVENRIASRKKSLANEFKDVTVTLERQEDKTFRLTALYSYAGGATTSNIADRLYFFMRESEWLLCDVHTGIELSNASRWKELKGDITAISKADFITLYPLFKESGYAVNNPQNPYGDWQMGGDGYKVWVENLNTQMRLWLRIKQPYGNTPKEKAEAVLAQIRAFAPAKGAASVEANWDANDIWVGHLYPYAGMDGKEIKKTVDYFFDKYAPGAVKDVRKILKKSL